MNEPIKQHYVSKFYLKNFTTTGEDNGDLYVYEKSTGQWRSKPSTPQREARAEHVNTILVNGKPSYMFDAFLSEIENSARSVVDRIIRDRVLPTTQEDKARFARFVASTAVRTPGHRTFYRQLVRLILEHALSDRAMKQNRSFARLGKLLFRFVPSAVDQVFSHEGMVCMIPSMTLYLAEIVLQRKWSLILADEYGPHFITSDNPVTGLLSQEIAIALSPLVAVVASDKIDSGVLQGNEKYVRVLNWLTFTHAQHFVYAHRKEELLQYDMEQLGKKPEFKSDLAHLEEALKAASA
jgi:Protein of unknown function (DUF4238)